MCMCMYIYMHKLLTVLEAVLVAASLAESIVDWSNLSWLRNSLVNVWNKMADNEQLYTNFSQCTLILLRNLKRTVTFNFRTLALTLSSAELRSSLGAFLYTTICERVQKIYTHSVYILWGVYIYTTLTLKTTETIKLTFVEITFLDLLVGTMTCVCLQP